MTASFRFALDGLCYALLTERNVKIHFIAGAAFQAWCLVVRPAPGDCLWAVAATVSVIAAELLNTAVERLADLAAAGRPHPLARLAKDVAAGAVLCTCAGAAGAGLYVLASTYPWHWLVFSRVHWQGAAANGFLLLALAGFAGRAQWRKTWLLAESRRWGGEADGGSGDTV
ncbi:MAG: diacylglycerol kinase family protein [Alicyclobacillus sp.]|nr:diacylglycerol kinase family protein [Alicyclobacillus sp.]